MIDANRLLVMENNIVITGLDSCGVSIILVIYWASLREFGRGVYCFCGLQCVFLLVTLSMVHCRPWFAVPLSVSLIYMTSI